MNPDPILVTGGSGQIGTALIRQGGQRIVAPGRDTLNLEDAGAIERWIAAEPWAMVINAAAYTAVDRAESEPDAADRLNHLAPETIAKAAAARDIPMIQLSTDYVFDGSAQVPYRETDPVAPLGVYGATKAAGEAAVRAAHPGAVILRTAWVISPWGSNFVRTMLRLAREREETGVVADQRGTPTSAADIAAALLTITDAHDRGMATPGTFHFTNAGEASWHDLAAAVFAHAAARGHKVPRLRAISTADYPTAARRPAYSVLDTRVIEQSYGIVPRPWRSALAEIMAALLD